MMIVLVTMSCVTLSLLLTINAASLHTDPQLQASRELGNDYGRFQHPALPRKLMVDKKVEDYESTALLSSNDQQMKASSGDHKSHKKGEEEEEVMMVHAAKGTRQEEWIERSDPTHEFFTMDYSHVRRRRPIHNKSFPKSIPNSP